MGGAHFPGGLIFLTSYFFRFFALFEKHGGYKTGKLKLKRPEQLQVRWKSGQEP